MHYFQKGYIITIAKINKLLQRTCAAATPEYGFTPSEIELLLFLMNNPAHDTASEIAQYRNVSKSLIAKTVESLCRRGLLSTERDGFDHRVVHLRMRAESGEIARRLQACEDTVFEQIEAGIPPEQLDAAARVFSILRENVDGLTKELDAQ